MAGKKKAHQVPVIMLKRGLGLKKIFAVLQRSWPRQGESKGKQKNGA